MNDSTLEKILEDHKKPNQSWVNLRKGSQDLQGKEHEGFGVEGGKHVRATALRDVRKIAKDTGISLEKIEELAAKRQKPREKRPSGRGSG